MEFGGGMMKMVVEVKVGIVMVGGVDVRSEVVV